MLRAFLKDSAIYFIPAVISGGLTLFLVPLYTRILSPADYGSLDMLIVFAGIVKLTIALEVSQGVARFYAGEPNPDRKVAYASSAFWFTVICYSVFATLSLIFTNSLAHWIMGQSGMETAFRLGIVYIWIDGIFYLIQNQFRWELRGRRYAVVSLLMTFVTASVAVGLAYGLRWSLVGLLIGMATGSAAGVGYGVWHLRRSFRFRFDFVRLKEMLAFSWPLVPSGIAVWVSTYVDRMMINHLMSIDEVGLYGIGFRVASIVGVAMVGFQGALTPLVYTHYQKADTPRQIARIFRLFIALALLTSLSITFFAIDILRLMTTEAFYGGAVVIVYLVPAVLLSQMYIFAPGVGIAKKTHLILWINIAGAILNAGFNFLLIPLFGIVGAALATMLGSLAVFTLYMAISQRLYHIPHHWRPIFLCVTLATMMAWWLPQGQLDDFTRWLINLLAIAVLAISILVMGLIQPAELQQAIKIIQTRLRASP